MKLFFFLFFFFKNAVNPTMGKLNAELSGHVTLNFLFNPYYNSFTKTCYKLMTYDWLVIVNNKRYADAAYKGRIETHEYNGRMDVRIWNLQREDAGIYRCQIIGSQNYIYSDYEVAINYRDSRVAPAWLSPKSTISTVPSLHTNSKIHLDSHSISSYSWGLKHTLGTVFGAVSITLIVVILIILGVAYRKKKGRDPAYGTSSVSTETHGKSLSSAPDIIPQPPQELNSIIYTTVDFKPHEETSELYANLCLSRLNSDRALKTQESVEYSTIARIV